MLHVVNKHMLRIPFHSDLRHSRYLLKENKNKVKIERRVTRNAPTLGMIVLMDIG